VSQRRSSRRRRYSIEGIKDLPQVYTHWWVKRTSLAICSGSTPARRQVSIVLRAESLYLGGVTVARESKA
jgi:hypothetical protein